MALLLGDTQPLPLLLAWRQCASSPAEGVVNRGEDDARHETDDPKTDHTVENAAKTNGSGGSRLVQVEAVGVKALKNPTVTSGHSVKAIAHKILRKAKVMPSATPTEKVLSFSMIFLLH
jgi:hypothetical protein